MRTIIIGVSCMLAACGSAPEASEGESLGEQADTLELPCSAYQQEQLINSGNWVVCGTRPFAQYTNFQFTNQTGSSISVRLQSGPDLVYWTLPAWSTTNKSRQYYGGFVRIEPVSSSIRVLMW